jgi:uncharacterized protein
MKMLIWFTLFITLSLGSVQSQETYKKGIDLIYKGIELYDKGFYEDALKVFDLVDESDSNYLFMLYEKGLTYSKLGQYDSVITLCNQILSEDSAYGHTVYGILGTAYDHSDDLERSIEVFKEGIRRYPYHYNLPYNLAITCFRKNKHDEASKYFAEALKLNPYHLASHYAMGAIEAAQGRYTHAIMSLTTYLLISNAGVSSKDALIMMEKIALNEFDYDDLKEIKAEKVKNDFHSLDALIKSGLALDKSYKAKVKVNAAIVKQLHMLVERFEYKSSGSEDFWMQFYGPLFHLIQQRKQIEPVTYFILFSASIHEVSKWLEKNNKKVDAFFELAAPELSKHRDSLTVPVNGTDVKLKAWFNEHVLQALGNVVNDDSDKKIGYWRFFQSNLNVESEGNYNKNYKRIGEWRFYHKNGMLASVENYNDKGELHGVEKNWNDKGVSISEINYVEGKKHGKQTDYYYCGTVSEVTNYAYGKIIGIVESYNYKGAVTYKTPYSEGEREGISTSFHNNGAKESDITFSDDTQNGPYIYYYDDGSISLKGEARDGKPYGQWLYYYDNGVKKIEEYYNDEGNNDSIYRKYTRYGILENEIFYKNNVLVTDKSFDSNDGLLWSELTFGEDDKLLKMVYYDKKGDIIANYDIGNGTTPIIGYYPTGEKKMDGSLEDGYISGKWLYYYRSGIRETEVNFKNNNKNGLMVDYYYGDNVFSRVQMKDGKEDGYFKQYFRNGALSREGWYSNGLKEGLWKLYDPFGTIVNENFFVNDEVCGWEREYDPEGRISTKKKVCYGKILHYITYDTNGVVIFDQAFHDGNGSIKLKCSNGNTLFEVPVECGDYNGNANWYYPNGNKYLEFTFSFGKYEGPYLEYAENGKIKSRGNFKNANRQGEWVYYYTDVKGGIEYKGAWNNDEREGRWHFYWPNGKINTIVDYREGERHGILERYDDNEKLMIQCFYELGRITGYRYKLKSGEFCDTIYLPNGTGKVEAFYDNGQLAVSETWENARRMDKQQWFYSNGKLMIECFYNDGDQTGEEVNYYSNGKMESRSNWRFGFRYGPASYYRPDGTLIRTCHYIFDELHGLKTLFDEKGQKISEDYWRGNVPY